MTYFNYFPSSPPHDIDRSIHISLLWSNLPFSMSLSSSQLHTSSQVLQFNYIPFPCDELAFSSIFTFASCLKFIIDITFITTLCRVKGYYYVTTWLKSYMYGIVGIDLYYKITIEDLFYGNPSPYARPFWKTINRWSLHVGDRSTN